VASPAFGYSGRTMADDPPVPPSPDPSPKKIADHPHHWTIFLSIGAIAVSLVSAGISMYSAHFAALQYENAKGVREDAREAAIKQAADVERVRRAAESSADAAAKTAAATQATVDLSRQSSERGERAWVRCAMVSVVQVPSPNQPAIAEAWVMNDGKTLARNVTVRQWISVEPAGKPFRPSYPTTEQRHFQLGPGSNELVSTTAAVSDAKAGSATGLFNKSAVWYVYGIAEYDDVFTSTRHVTTWCKYYLPERGGAGNVLPSCSAHNLSN
jgi:hypothetical protein